MLALVGFIMVVAMMVLLLKFKWLPAVVFTILPVTIALLIGTSFNDTMGMAAKGLSSVLSVVALFIGSITYFGIMNDVGLFDGFIKFLVTKVRSNILSVMLIAVALATITHLDGSGTTTLLITVPALLPVVDALKIRRLPFSTTVGLVIGVMNILPWGGPLGRVSVVTGADPVAMWISSLPIMIFGMVLVIGHCFFIAWEEKKKGYYTPGGEFNLAEQEISEADRANKRPQLVWVNLALTVFVLLLLFLGVPSYLPFILGTGVALLVNFGKDGSKAQTARIKAQAPNILPMIFTIICAGIFLGIFNGTGMVEAMATTLINWIPASLGRFVHIIMGILSVPLSMVFDADTKILGFLPILIDIGSHYGVDPVKAGLAMAYGHNMGVSMCMTSATVYFGLGLYGLEYGESIKYSFWRRCLIGGLMILFGAVVGIL